MARGHLHERKPGVWSLVAEAPRDLLTGRRRQVWRTARGTRRDAERALRRLLVELEDARDAAAGPPTLAAFAARWLEQVRAARSPLTHRAYEQQLRSHLLPALGALRLDRITPAQVAAYYTHALTRGRVNGRGGLSRTTVHTHHRILCQLFGLAVRWEIVARSPMGRVESPGRAPRSWSVLSPEETRRLLDSTRGQWVHGPILLVAAGGLRRGECLALRWSDVDLPRRILRVCRSVNWVDGGPRFSSPKGAKERVVTLPPFAVAGLASLERTGELVCGDAFGKPVHPSTLGKAFARALAAAGLPKVRFHDTRHGHASHLGQQRVPIKVIQERLGHSSPVVTLSLYQHVLPGMQEEAAAEVEALLSSNAPSNRPGRTLAVRVVRSRLQR